MSDLFGLAKFAEGMRPMVDTMKLQELGALALVACELRCAGHTDTARSLAAVLNLRVRSEVLMLPSEKEVKP